MRLSDDQLHDLLNAGLGEGKVEVLAVLDSEDRIDTAEVAALCGMSDDNARKHLRWLDRAGFVICRRTSKLKKPTWRLSDRALSPSAAERLPLPTRLNAPDDEVREAAHAERAA